MADYVEASLESMIPELNKLLKKKIFKESEIKMIIKNRRNYEYSMQSRSSHLSDYYRYLNYEITLYKLTQTRIKLKSKKIKDARYLGINRIIRIFEKAVKRYHANQQIWVDYFNFCEQSKMSKTLSTAFARAIQYHPLEESFWIRAAFWEYKKNHNMNSARILLQRALRVIKSSKNLWLKYCKLELDYRKKFMDRIQLLGINAENVLENTNLSRKVQLPDEEGVDKEEFVPEITDFSNSFLEGTIPLFIFKTASSKFVGDYQFQIEFIKLFRQYDDTEKLVETVIQSIQSNFPDHPKCQSMLSILPLSSLSHPLDDTPESFDTIKICENSFRSYLENSSDPVSFFTEFSNFYNNMIALCINSNQLKMKEYLMDAALDLYSSSLKEQIISENTLYHWCDLYFLRNDNKSALEIAEKFSTLFPKSAEIWKHLVHLHLKLRLISSSKSAEDQKKFDVNIFQIYEKAFEQVKDLDQLLTLWKSFFDFAIKTNFKPSSFLSFFRKSVVSLFSSKSAKEQLISYIIDLSFAIYDIEFFRSIYAIAFEFPPVSISLFQKIINVECSQLSIDPQRIRSLFEKLVSLPAKELDDPNLWIHYLKFEMSQNNFEKVNHVHWKAQKFLSQTNQKILAEQYAILKL